MKPIIRTFFIALLASWNMAFAQETFSIVAVDTNSGKIGSAGASCLDSRDIEEGAAIISSVIPGKGAIHTQAFYRKANQQNAEQKLQEGLTADSIVQWLVANDALNSPERRQYGIALFGADQQPQTAAFTGSEADSFKGALTGRTYAIQGNILKGPVVLDTMEAAFLSTEGPLEERLMAALKAAAIPGADRRCLREGVSSQSAFLRVAKPEDTRQDLFIDLKVTRTPEGVEPIDSLKQLFNNSQSTGLAPDLSAKIQVSKTYSRSTLRVRIPATLFQKHRLKLQLWSVNGHLLKSVSLEKTRQQLDLDSMSSGMYLFRILDDKGRTLKTGKYLHR